MNSVAWELVHGSMNLKERLSLKDVREAFTENLPLRTEG